MGLSRPPYITRKLTLHRHTGQALVVTSTPTKLFQLDTVHKYRVHLRSDSSLETSPLPSPAVSMLKLQYFEPVGARIEPDWEENERTE